MSCVTLHSIRELRGHLDRARRQGRPVGVVPTMGALHLGHLSLVRAAAQRSEEVVVTIFVNPTQFGPGEDFERYPRTLAKDTELAKGAGATVVFAPDVSEMYPAGEQTRVKVAGLSQGLCGVSRPGHFEGVATVVAKLFNVVGPGTYFFGKKDYQQWRLIERLALDLLFPVEVIGLPTVREADGLAMSSRNAYLEPEARRFAAMIPLALQTALDSYRAGERDSQVLAGLAHARLMAPLMPEYLEVRDALTLLPVQGQVEGPVLLALAARLGSTRLIDNIVLEPGAPDVLPSGSPGSSG